MYVKMPENLVTFCAGCFTALPIEGRPTSRLLFPKRLADNTVEMSEITDHSAEDPSDLEKTYGLQKENLLTAKG